MSTKNEFVEAFGWVALVVIIAPAAALYCGWATSVLWGWFMVPKLGLPPITAAHGAGLVLLTAGLRGFQIHETPKCITRSVSERVSGIIFGPLLVLALGWLLSWYV